jgi:hypothetical protein
MSGGEMIHTSTLSEAGFDSLEAASQLRTASPADVDRSPGLPRGLSTRWLASSQTGIC